MPSRPLCFALTGLALLATGPATLSAQDYVITINGKATEIDLDSPTRVSLADGTEIELHLARKEFVRFTGDLFSFEHKSTFQANRSDLGDGVYQTIILTPIGTGMLVQEYTRFDPSGLVDTMLRELTKEEVEYGYKYNERVVRKQVGEVSFVGKEAVTTYPGEEWTRAVLTYAGKDQGLLVVTFIEKDNYDTEQELIDRLWRTLELEAGLR